MKVLKTYWYIYNNSTNKYWDTIFYGFSDNFCPYDLFETKESCERVLPEVKHQCMKFGINPDIVAKPASIWLDFDVNKLENKLSKIVNKISN